MGRLLLLVVVVFAWLGVGLDLTSKVLRGIVELVEDLFFVSLINLVNEYNCDDFADPPPKVLPMVPFLNAPFLGSFVLQRFAATPTVVAG